MGRQALKNEHRFNRLAGFTAPDDRIPFFMCQEELPDSGTVFDVPDEELDSLARDLA